MRPLIFATRRPPLPLDNGARIRTMRLAQALAQRFDVVLVTFADGPAYDETATSREELEEALPGARVELVAYGRRPPGGARRNLLRRRSDTFGHYATPSLRAALGRLLAERPDAVLHLDDPGVALAGIDLPAALTVVAPHNVEHRIIRDIGRRMPAAHRPGMAVEWRKIAAEERRCWRSADLCVAVSEIDAATMRAGGARAVEICPNGTDPHDALPLPPPEDGVLRLLFVGSLRFWPYAHAMSWFVREALPAILRSAGPVAIDVVGEHDAGLVDHPDVHYHGRVDSVLPFYARAHALVLPVFEGSGTRLKVVEAAMLGRTVVSTALGVEGLGLREEESYLRAEDAEGFGRAVARLRAEMLSDLGAAERRTALARAALAGLTWPALGEHLADLYEARLAPTGA